MLKCLAFSLSLILILATSVVAQQDETAEKKTDQKTNKQDAAPAKPKVGDMAPDWELVGSDGQTYKLSSYKGKQGVVVAWYPAALTGG